MQKEMFSQPQILSCFVSQIFPFIILFNSNLWIKVYFYLSLSLFFSLLSLSLFRIESPTNHHWIVTLNSLPWMETNQESSWRKWNEKKGKCEQIQHNSMNWNLEKLGEKRMRVSFSSFSSPFLLSLPCCDSLLD